MKRLPTLFALTVVSSLLVGCKEEASPKHPRSKQVAVEKARGLATITASSLMETVRYLTSDELNGRAAGSREFMTAATEIATQLKKAGLAPGVGDGYLQKLELEHNQIDAPYRLEVVRGQESKQYQLGDDFLFRGFTGSGEMTAPVAFVGYGISTPERGYDDYAGIDVEGKVALAFKRGPEWKVDDNAYDEETLPRFKSTVALAHGARALLLVTSPKTKWRRNPIVSVLHGPGTQPEGFPQLHISPEVAADLLAGSDKNLEKLQEDIDSKREPRSFALGASVRIEAHATYRDKAESANLIAVLPGVDPELKHECIVVGAHLDHVGNQEDIILRGANDNASGSAVVVAVADALATATTRPRRTVVFVLFTGEEQGLIGSRYFVAHPYCAAQDTVAMINVDCVGHGDGIQVGGGKSYPELWKIARHNDSRAGERMIEETWPGGGADAEPFHEAGIPTAYFATHNSYTHLHVASDTADTLDPELLESVAKLVFLTVDEVAQGEYQREKAVSP